jgi:hypothetical protein
MKGTESPSLALSTNLAARLWETMKLLPHFPAVMKYYYRRNRPLSSKINLDYTSCA